jgi:hypothetical protein
MRGCELKGILETLGLSVTNVADLTATHMTTVYRWLAAGKDDIKVEGLSTIILSCLREVAKGREVNEHSQRLRLRLRRGQPLGAIEYLIGWVFECRRADLIRQMRGPV